VVRDSLDISEDKMNLSRKLLLNRGNLSSASLPFMWDSILKDESINNETLVTSIAFGPGLTAAGALMKVKRKQCASKPSGIFPLTLPH
jgi:predicted naringenin-chalcone synthase